jgi:Putative zinc-finger
MKPHDTYLAFAAMAMDEPLAPSDRSRLEDHLAGCPACAREVARLRGDAREFAELAVPPLPARRGDEILAAALRPGVVIHPARFLAVAAILGLLLVGSLAAGSQLIRRDDDLSVVLPLPSATTSPSASPVPPTVAPTPSPTLEPAASLSPVPGFVLRTGPATGGCDAIGIDYQSLTWRIDPAAEEPVTAVTNTGATLRTTWAPGFTAGTAAERVIRDPAGVIVVRDGDQLRVGDRLAGYYVCLGPANLTVYTEDPQ